MAGYGAPPGNNYAAKAKRWSEAVERAIAAYPDAPNTEGCNELMLGLNNAAQAFVAKMMVENDIAFFREFGDRMEGKPAQPLEHSGEMIVNIPHSDVGL
jgi:hypothetical protein